MKSVPLTEAKDKLSALVDEADTTHEIIQITRHGRVAAVIMSADDLESLNETLHALTDPRSCRGACAGRRGLRRRKHRQRRADPQTVRPEVTGRATPWSVQLSPTAVRALDRLPGKIAAAVVEFVTGTLPTDPTVIHTTAIRVRRMASGAPWRLPNHVPRTRGRPCALRRAHRAPHPHPSTPLINRPGRFAPLQHRGLIPGGRGVPRRPAADRPGPPRPACRGYGPPCGHGNPAHAGGAPRAVTVRPDRPG